MSAWPRWIMFILVMSAWMGVVGGCAAPPSEEGSSGARAAESNVQLGVEYMRQGKQEIALEKFKRALDQDPESASAHHYIAVLYEQLGQSDLADKNYRKAVQLDPDSPRIHNNYGQYLCEHKRFAEAEEHFLVAAGDPLYEGKALAYTNAGMCAQRFGDTEKAEQYFQRALSIQPKFSLALFQLMKSRYDRGEYLQARAFLERYQAEAPVSANSLWWGVRIERALGDQNAAASYALRLQSDYPDSVEAKWLQEGN